MTRTSGMPEEPAATSCSTLAQAAEGVERALECLRGIDYPGLVVLKMTECAEAALTQLLKACSWHCDDDGLTPEEIAQREAANPHETDGVD